MDFNSQAIVERRQIGWFVMIIKTEGLGWVWAGGQDLCCLTYFMESVRGWEQDRYSFTKEP